MPIRTRGKERDLGMEKNPESLAEKSGEYPVLEKKLRKRKKKNRGRRRKKDRWTQKGGKRSGSFQYQVKGDNQVRVKKQGDEAHLALRSCRLRPQRKKEGKGRKKKEGAERASKVEKEGHWGEAKRRSAQRAWFPVQRVLEGGFMGGVSLTSTQGGYGPPPGRGGGAAVTRRACMFQSELTGIQVEGKRRKADQFWVRGMNGLNRGGGREN